RRAQSDAADAVAAELLLHLAGQSNGSALVFLFDADGIVDFRQVTLLELGVERRADHLHDLANLVAGRLSVRYRRHDNPSFVRPGKPGCCYFRASAPPMTSAISLVI